MWRARANRSQQTVVCIACGTSLPRADAREYDKAGNRWERQGKEFEHLCKACFRDLCHQPRAGLETLLGDIEEHGMSQEEFLQRYLTEVRARFDADAEPEEHEEQDW